MRINRIGNLHSAWNYWTKYWQRISRRNMNCLLAVLVQTVQWTVNVWQLVTQCNGRKETNLDKSSILKPYWFWAKEAIPKHIHYPNPIIALYLYIRVQCIFCSFYSLGNMLFLCDLSPPQTNYQSVFQHLFQNRFGMSRGPKGLHLEVGLP